MSLTMPPRQIIAFALAFLLGGATAQEKDLTWSMLMVWVAVGVALGHRLALRSAVSTGAIFGGGLGFSLVLYTSRGPLALFENFPAILLGTAIGAPCGVLATTIGARVSAAIFGPAKKPEWDP
jgi:hypothetical protein